MVYCQDWGGCQKIWGEGLCEFQTSCLAWLILWVVWLNSCPLKNRMAHRMCWQDCALPVPWNLDAFSRLWGTVWVTIHAAYTWLNLLFVCTRCFMALIRGVKCKFPCPICLVPHTQMCDGSTHPLWTSENMQRVYKEAQEMASSADQQGHLKKFGLHNVKVWKVHLTMTPHWIPHLAEYILVPWEFWSIQVTFIWPFA